MDTKIIGKQIATARKKLHQSQAQFAKNLFVSQQAVAKWENGESIPDIFMLAKIGDLIGTKDICYFLGQTHSTCNCDCEHCTSTTSSH